MTTVLIDIRDVTTRPITGDTVTLTAPAPRPATGGGVTRPFNRLVPLDDNGRATVEVDPGPLRVTFHDGYGREVVIDTDVPNLGDVLTLRDLITMEIGDVDDVPGIREALAGKADKEHQHTTADIEDLDDVLDGKAPAEHAHAISDVRELQDVLDGKAPKAHTHTIAEIKDLIWSLDQKVSITDLEASTKRYASVKIAELVDGAPESLDTLREVADAFKEQDDAIQAVFVELGKRAMKSHTHPIGDVTGLQTALDGKAAKVHSHDIADVTGLQTALDGKASATAVGDSLNKLVPVFFWRKDDTWKILGGAPEGYTFWSAGRIYPLRGWYLVITIGTTKVTLRSSSNSYLNLDMRAPVDVVRVDANGYFICQNASARNGLVLIPIGRGLV